MDIKKWESQSSINVNTGSTIGQTLKIQYKLLLGDIANVRAACYNIFSLGLTFHCNSMNYLFINLWTGLFNLYSTQHQCFSTDIKST